MYTLLLRSDYGPPIANNTIVLYGVEDKGWLVKDVCQNGVYGTMKCRVCWYRRGFERKRGLSVAYLLLSGVVKRPVS
jgi:hypothetical protein